MCIPENEDPYVDQCGVQCGTNDCVDCEGVPNGGKILNLCGVCKDPANVNEGMQAQISHFILLQEIFLLFSFVPELLLSKWWQFLIVHVLKSNIFVCKIEEENLSGLFYNKQFEWFLFTFMLHL